jgi:hypothetical protein
MDAPLLGQPEYRMKCSQTASETVECLRSGPSSTNQAQTLFSLCKAILEQPFLILPDELQEVKTFHPPAFSLYIDRDSHGLVPGVA